MSFLRKFDGDFEFDRNTECRNREPTVVLCIVHFSLSLTNPLSCF